MCAYQALREKHLHSVLAEFVFCFNRRGARDTAFRILYSVALTRNPNTGKMLIIEDPTA